MKSTNTNASLGRWLARTCVLLVAAAALLAMAIPEAEANRGSGSRSGGRAAQSSVSGANRSMAQPSGATSANRGSASAGNRSTAAGNRSGASAGSRDTGSSGSRNTANSGNTNRNNVNTGDRNNISTGDINIGNDINIDIDGGYGYGARPCCAGGYYRPIAAGIVIGSVAVTTAAVMGSYYHALPPGCTVVVRAGVSYHYCGSVYYQQTWSGNDVVYVVVAP